MPIFVANFVLMEYGTGAVMAVPTHDQRDFEFAKKYGLPLIVVIQPEDQTLDAETMTEAYEGEGFLVNSGQFNGMGSVKARETIAQYLEERGLGGKESQLSAEGLGDFQAALLGSTDPHHLLREVWNRSRSRKRSSCRPSVQCGSHRNGRIAPYRAEGICGGQVPQVWRARSKGDGHHGHLCRILLVF